MLPLLKVRRNTIVKRFSGVAVASDDLPTTSATPYVFNRRLWVNSSNQPILDGSGNQRFYDQMNSFYYTHSEVEATELGYVTFSGALARETVMQTFNPVALASFASPWTAGGFKWAGRLRIDVPIAAFAGRPTSIVVYIDGTALPAKSLTWTVVK